MTATDINQTVLEEAGKKALNPDKVSLKLADVYNLPAFGKSFDVVFAVDFFCHVPKSKHNLVVQALKNCLNAGGAILFCDQLPRENSLTGYLIYTGGVDGSK